MKRTLIFLIALVYSISLIAQLECDNIKLLGIYENNVNTSQLSLLISNSSLSDDGNGNAYTEISIVNILGDTIVNSNPVFALPNNLNDTIVYNIKINESFDWIGDLPEYNQGTLITKYPNCEIEYNFDTIPQDNLPFTTNIDCDDFKVVGLYETANGGTKNYSLILTNTNQDSLRNWDAGYTNFQFYNTDNEPVSLPSGPHFLVPSTAGDTTIIHVEFTEGISLDEELILRMTSPECDVNYSNRGIVRIEELINQKVKIYPNPTDGIIKVESKNSIGQINVIDLYGIVLKSSNQNNISLDELNSGAYLIEINFKNNRLIKKIMKY